MLDTQINIYSVDTGNFYSNHEAHLHWLNHKLRSERNALVQKSKDIASELFKYGIEQSDLDTMLKSEYDYSGWGEDTERIQSLGNEYVNLKELIVMKNRKIKYSKDTLLQLLENKVNANIVSDGKHHIRELKENDVSDKKIISVFDSSFTRMIHAQPNELSEDFMVVQVYYFDIIKDLIYYGFTYKGEKYIYFTSSAGQIRTKKTVFIKESTWKKYEKTIMCGLTIDVINSKGGNNPNKHLAYTALTNSATDAWEEFDIDKTIVIDDFETNVFGTYDLVDDADYSIKRVSDYVPITHTDGAGMMLPHMGKNRMVRLPWVKGLLGKFDYVHFIEVNGCSSIIKDIYGKEHDIIAEGIEIIFTKSQFKMWKYYDSWEQYKEYYKKYHCTAGYTNLEEDRIRNAKINYQMLQTLTDITDEEILEIAKPSINKLQNLCSSVENIKDAFGITPYNLHKNSFQKSVELYPDLLNDEYVKTQLRNTKDSMIKQYKSGKLQIYGKYTFLLPDFYAACQYWFQGIKDPEGLLADQEVFCWLFRKSDKLDCLRSPHLYKEHAIRKNIAYCKNERQKLIREWFDTDAIYTSCHDLISKILQFDVDGDKSLVVSDRKFIEVAERNMKGIVPLYYNMRKASPTLLTSENIYNGLVAAFTGGNIGLYSNNISKIWNSEVFISGTPEEKQEAIDLVKLLCMENNFVIDYAKTLYKPQRPKDVHEKIIAHTKENVPHFFKYAKDKDEVQVSNINASFVNKLNSIIPNPRINCRSLKLGTIDYKLLMHNPDIECRVDFTDRGKLIKEKTDPLIVKYCELSSKHHFQINLNYKENLSPDLMKHSQIVQDLLYKNISNEIKTALSKFGYSESEIADILVKYLYGIKKSKHKVALWLCYGNIIYENIKENGCKNNHKSIQCVDCGEWFDVLTKNNNTCRCPDCYEEYRKNRKLETQRARRNKMKSGQKIL